MPEVMEKTLRDLRLDAGLTLLQVAEHIRVSVGSLSKWERGLSGMHPRFRPRLARLYKCSREDIRLALANIKSPAAAPKES